MCQPEALDSLDDLSPETEARLQEKRQQAIAAIHHAAKQRLKRLSCAPIEGAAPRGIARKSLGNVQLNVPRCAVAPKVRTTSKFPPPRSSLGRPDIWIEADRVEEEDEELGCEEASESPVCDPRCHARPYTGAGADDTSLDQGVRTPTKSAPEARTPPQHTPPFAEEGVLQFTPLTSPVGTPSRLPSEDLHGAAPSLEVMAEALVTHFAAGCWRALCRAIPSDCCSVSPVPITHAPHHVPNRRRSRYRRSIGELVVSREYSSAETPWFEDETEDFGGRSTFGGGAKPVARVLAMDADADQSLPPGLWGGAVVKNDETKPLADLSQLRVFDNLEGDIEPCPNVSQLEGPESCASPSDGGAAVPFMSTLDESLSTRLASHRAAILDEWVLEDVEDGDDVVPACWAEADQLLLNARRAGELAVAQDPDSSCCFDPAAEISQEIAAPPQWDELNSRLENLLASLPEDDDLVNSLASEMAQTLSGPSEDSRRPLSSDSGAVPKRNMFVPESQADSTKADASAPARVLRSNSLQAQRPIFFPESTVHASSPAPVLRSNSLQTQRPIFFPESPVHASSPSQVPRSHSLQAQRPIFFPQSQTKGKPVPRLPLDGLTSRRSPRVGGA